MGGAGISCLLSIAYDLSPWLRARLTLGDEPSPGTLGLKTPVFLTQVSLLIPAFSLLYSPLVLPVQLPPVYNAPLPMISHPAASVLRFSPVTSSALDHSTSELLRTL